VFLTDLFYKKNANNHTHQTMGPIHPMACQPFNAQRSVMVQIANHDFYLIKAIPLAAP
jgi:hypothetical protein